MQGLEMQCRDTEHGGPGWGDGSSLDQLLRAGFPRYRWSADPGMEMQKLAGDLAVGGHSGQRGR